MCTCTRVCADDADADAWKYYYIYIYIYYDANADDSCNSTFPLCFNYPFERFSLDARRSVHFAFHGIRIISYHNIIHIDVRNFNIRKSERTGVETIIVSTRMHATSKWRETPSRKLVRVKTRDFSISIISTRPLSMIIIIISIIIIIIIMFRGKGL